MSKTYLLEGSPPTFVGLALDLIEVMKQNGHTPRRIKAGSRAFLCFCVEFKINTVAGQMQNDYEPIFMGLPVIEDKNIGPDDMLVED